MIAIVSVAKNLLEMDWWCFADEPDVIHVLLPGAQMPMLHRGFDDEEIRIAEPNLDQPEVEEDDLDEEEEEEDDDEDFFEEDEEDDEDEWENENEELDEDDDTEIPGPAN